MRRTAKAPRYRSTIPLRDDLAGDLNDWLTGKEASHKLFSIPTGFVRILNRDLKTAGIPKRDERGRTVDIHALRHTFGTLLSTSGVAPRTAQAAMRHSKIDLTMNTYTDPKVLDVQSAMEALPVLKFPEPLAPMLAPAGVVSGENVADAVILGRRAGNVSQGDETPPTQ